MQDVTIFLIQGHFSNIPLSCPVRHNAKTVSTCDGFNLSNDELIISIDSIKISLR
jgi:hypothetical protein